MTLSHWLIYNLSQQLVAAICRRRVHTLRQRCYRSFCRSDWFVARMHHVTQGDTTCCSDVSPSVSRPLNPGGTLRKFGWSCTARVLKTLLNFIPKYTIFSTLFRPDPKIGTLLQTKFYPVTASVCVNI